MMPATKTLERTKPVILKQGRIKSCIHHEEVIGLIGTCVKCGQVRQYPQDYAIDYVAMPRLFGAGWGKSPTYCVVDYD